MQQEATSLRPSWHQSLAAQISVTSRDFATVHRHLGLAEHYLRSGARVLSIGEGLSAFSRGLNEQNPVKTVALDPIYRDARIFSPDPAEVKKYLQVAYGDTVSFAADESPDPTKVLLPDLDRAVAGSVYELPFNNACFDLVLGYGLIEHVDWGLAFPELLRVLNPLGEIRLGGEGGAWFNLSAEKTKVFSALKHGRRSKNVEGMDYLYGRDDVSCYLTSYPAGQMAKHWILRRDHNLPGIELEVFRVNTKRLIAQTPEEVEDPRHNSIYYFGLIDILC